MATWSDEEVARRWMLLLCQRVAVRANHEDDESGRFFQDRFKLTRVLDEASLLACAAYLDLNLIRAAMAQTLQTSDHTSVPGKRGKTPPSISGVLKRLGCSAEDWCELTSDFGKLFGTVAGRSDCVDDLRSHRTHRRYHLRRRARELMSIH